MEDGVGTVSFEEMQVSALKALNATVDHLDKGAELYWRYTAVKLDNGGTSGTVAEGVANSQPVVDGWETTGLNQTHTFSVGKWRFTLYAFSSATKGTLDADHYIYSGSTEATVEANTKITVTVGVEPVVTGTTVKGKLDFTNAEKPSGYKDSSVLAYKYKPDGGTESSWNQTKVYDLNPGSYTAYVGVFNSSSALTDPLVTSSIAVTVYRGLTTNIGGKVDDQTGGIDFDATMPAAAVTNVSAKATNSTLPAANLSVEVSPDTTTAGGSAMLTSVAVPESVIDTPDAWGTLSTDDTITTEVAVTAYPVAVASSTISVKTGGGNDKVIAALDCKLTVSKNGGTPVEVTNFKSDKYVTVTTYIVKNLAAPEIFYSGTSGSDPIAYSDSGSHEAGYIAVYDYESEATWTAAGSPEGKTKLNTNLGYAKDTGKLVFKTNHFSTFQIEMTAAMIIAETNTAYEELACAISAIKDGQTIKFLKDVANARGLAIDTDTTFTIDFDGHTYTLLGPGAGSAGTGRNGFQLIRNQNITFKNIV